MRPPMKHLRLVMLVRAALSASIHGSARTPRTAHSKHTTNQHVLKPCIVYTSLVPAGRGEFIFAPSVRKSLLPEGANSPQPSAVKRYHSQQSHLSASDQEHVIVVDQRSGCELGSDVGNLQKGSALSSGNFISSAHRAHARSPGALASPLFFPLPYWQRARNSPLHAG